MSETTETKPTRPKARPKPETITLELRSLPDAQSAGSPVERAVHALMASEGVVPEGKGAVVATYKTAKSAASQASRFRKRFPGATFVASDVEVLCRPDKKD